LGQSLSPSSASGAYMRPLQLDGLLKTGSSEHLCCRWQAHRLSFPLLQLWFQGVRSSHAAMSRYQMQLVLPQCVLTPFSCSGMCVGCPEDYLTFFDHQPMAARSLLELPSVKIFDQSVPPYHANCHAYDAQGAFESCADNIMRCSMGQGCCMHRSLYDEH